MEKGTSHAWDKFFFNFVFWCQRNVCIKPIWSPPHYTLKKAIEHQITKKIKCK